MKSKNKDKDKEVKSEIHNIIKSEELLDYIRTANNPWKILFFNFLRGTAYGLGVIFGTAIILAIIVYVSRFFIDYPVIGEWFGKVLEYIKK